MKMEIGFDDDSSNPIIYTSDYNSETNKKEARVDFLCYLNNYNSYFLYFDFCAQSSNVILGFYFTSMIIMVSEFICINVGPIALETST